jgi:hypothetical protein
MVASAVPPAEPPRVGIGSTEERTHVQWYSKSATARGCINCLTIWHFCPTAGVPSHRASVPVSPQYLQFSDADRLRKPIESGKCGRNIAGP